MRRLLPTVADLDLADTYAGLVLPAPPNGSARSHVALGMVASADGAVTVEGRSGGLGGDADAVAFRRLRDACDAILVGAGTARTEGYGPPRAPETRAAGRRTAGLAPAPQLLVVTASADLDPGARLFGAARDPDVPVPIVITRARAPRERVDALREVTEVVELGDEDVDLDAVLRWTRERGLDRVLCEGGPFLNGHLLRADLVDELFVTVAPLLTAGRAARLATGPVLDPPVDLELVELHEHAGELLLRYRTVRR